ncbi:hypothetical protein [Actinophytocola sp.]|nr:hypothetical protein [Actinophytocola sp.]HYQ65416.1 hypothetical protein [Actinophytocola sp.]
MELLAVAGLFAGLLAAIPLVLLLHFIRRPKDVIDPNSAEPG